MIITIDLPLWVWTTLCIALTFTATTRALVNIQKIKHLKEGLRRE